MINFTYAGLIWKMHRGVVIFGMLFIAFLQFIILWVFSSLNYIPMLESFFNQLPPQLKILFDQDFTARLSLQGMAAFGFNHPIVLFMLGLAAITISARQIAGHAESGFLELLIAYPFQRSRFFVTLWVTISLFLLIMIAGGLTGSITTLMIKAHLTPAILLKLLKIALNLWVLFVLIVTYTLLISSYSRDAGRAGFTGAAVTVVFYFLNFLSSLWEQAAFLRYGNIFHYYQPRRIMFDENQWWIQPALLLGITAICFAIGFRQFLRRDIP